MRDTEIKIGDGIIFNIDSLYTQVEDINYHVENPTLIESIVFWVQNGAWDGSFYPESNKILIHETNMIIDVFNFEITSRPLTIEEKAKNYLRNDEGDPKEIINELLKFLEEERKFTEEPF